MMRLDPDDFGDTATEHSGPCSTRSLCDSCAADLALLARNPDHLPIEGSTDNEGHQTLR